MYSTADIAKRLGCTPQAVNKYKRKVEKRDQKQLGQSDPADGRRTLFTEDEVSLIAEFAPKIPVTPLSDEGFIEAELVDGKDEVLYKSSNAMTLGLRRTSLPAAQSYRFDLAAAQQETTWIQQHSGRLAQRGDDLLSDFAVGEMAAAAADIQRTIATMKANAMGDAVAQLGKPLAAEAEADGVGG